MSMSPSQISVATSGTGLQLHDGDDPSPALQTWYIKVKLSDFKPTVAVQIEFLWEECWDIDIQSAKAGEPTTLCKHPI